MGAIRTACVLILLFAQTALAEERGVTLATDATVRDSGLLEALAPHLGKGSDLVLKVRVGRHADILELGRRGEADVLLVASSDEAEEFVRAGYGARRRVVMRSPLVLVGPPDDPARLRGLGPAKAVAALARTEGLFVSGGPESAGYPVERTLWQRASLVPRAPWYLEVGAGTAAALRLASDRGGYALADRATWVALSRSLRLSVVVEGVKVLQAEYVAIEVKQRQQAGGAGGATALVDFLVSAEAQALIQTFGSDRYGQPLFVPATP